MVSTHLGRNLCALIVILGAQGLAAAQGLPPVPVPPGNPITPEKAILGKILFWDEQLSSDNTVSCGTCHRPSAGGADPRIGVNPGPDGIFGNADDVFGSPGVRRSDQLNRFINDPLFGHATQVTGRAAPSYLMAQWSQSLFWDGRATSAFEDPETGALLQPGQSAYESQAVGPILSSVEMAHDQRDWSEVVGKLFTVRPLKLASNLPAGIQAALTANPTYPDLFNAAFGDPNITAARIGQALATHQRSLVADQTPYDRFVGGDPTALTPQEQRGLQVFNAQGLCNFCHIPPLFTDSSFHNIGVRPASEDIGREAVTSNPMDRGAFKTPQLRNFTLKPTYMHNGGLRTVREVVNFYDRGGDFNTNLSPIIFPLNLSQQDKDDLVAFLEGGLLDPRVQAETTPFDRPTLYTETYPEGSNAYGMGTTGSGGFVPTLLSDYPVATDDPDFKIGIVNGVGGETAFLFVSAAPAPAGTFALGLPVYVDLSVPLWLTLPLGGVGPGAGSTTFSAIVPSAPGLAGLNVYVQALLTDPGVPLGATVTEGAAIPIF